MYNIASCMFQDSFKVKYKVSDAVQFLSEMDETWIWQIIVTLVVVRCCSSEMKCPLS